MTARVAGWATGSEPLRIFTTLGRHRRFFRVWLPFSAWCLFGTDLPRRDVELLVLRTAWNSASVYEWAQHTRLAQRAGVRIDELHRLPGGPANEGWSPRQRALLQATDELHANRVLTDRTRDELASVLTERELLELCVIVGHYELVAMALNSLGVRPEPAIQARLDATSAARAAELDDRLTSRRQQIGT